MRLSQHVREAWGQMILPTKDIPGPSTKDWNSINIRTIHIHANKLKILLIYIKYIIFHQLYITDT